MFLYVLQYMFLSIFGGGTMYWTLMCPCLSTFFKKKKKYQNLQKHLLLLRLSEIFDDNYMEESLETQDIC